MSAFHNNLLLGSAKTADLGDPIHQSLRFQGGQQLTNSLITLGNGDWTISFWVKWSADKLSTPKQAIISTAGGNAVGGFLAFYNSAAQPANRRANTYSSSTPAANYGFTSVTGNYSAAKFSDPAAWYHFVLVNKASGACEFYVNGVLSEINTSYGFQWNGAGIRIGNAEVTTNVTNYFLDGYLADFHLIDGQTLLPSAFGKENGSGVWVPITPSISDYGANGFHLTFDSNQTNNIGHDSAPVDPSLGHNTANHFTADNFETAAISATNWDNDIDYDDTPTNNYATLNSVLARSYNIPVYQGGDLDFQNANLKTNYGAGGSGNAMAGFGMPGGSGKWYWEVTLKDQLEGTVGIVSEDYDLEEGTLEYADEPDGWAWWVSTGTRENAGNETQNSHTPFAVDNTIGFLLDTDNGTCTIEINGSPQTANAGAKFTNIPTDKTIFPYYTHGGGGGNVNLFWNFGQMPFLYAPTGYQSLATNNLTEPTIKDGSDHFRAISAGPDMYTSGANKLGGNWSAYLSSTHDWSSATYTADKAFDGSTTTYSSTTTNASSNTFAPDVPISFSTSIEVNTGQTDNTATWNGNTVSLSDNTWVTVYSGAGEISTTTPLVITSAGNGAAIRGIKVDGDVLIDYGPLPAARAAFPNGLWWIKDRDNSNDHQLVDIQNSPTSGSETAIITGGATNQGKVLDYVAPTGNSVAWCWKAGDSATTAAINSISAGVPSIASTVRANTDAGFSIVKWSGNGAVGTIAHGLNEPPEFIIGKTHETDPEVTSSITVFHKDISPYTLLSSNNGITQNTDNIWNLPSMTSNVFGVNGPTGLTNVNNCDCTAYVWHSVPGYSKFGSYTGNSDLDNVFLYTGFKPAFVLIKSTNSNAGTSDWQIYDTTRSPNNPCEHFLSPNNTVAETTGFDIDILSNGFKLRSTNGPNATSSDCIYAAFAEHPFGGENTAPATAR